MSALRKEKSHWHPVTIAHSFLDHLSYFVKDGRFGNVVFICMIAELDEKKRSAKIRVVEHGHDFFKSRMINSYLNHKLKTS